MSSGKTVEGREKLGGKCFAGDLTVAFEPLSEAAAVKPAEAWRRFRERAGRRTRIASDFLIGAHALSAADRLLTRYCGVYRRYFAGLMVLDPSA